MPTKTARRNSNELLPGFVTSQTHLKLGEMVYLVHNSSLKRIGSKEWFVREPDVTPDRLPEALNVLFLLSKCRYPIDLHYINHQGPRFQLKISLLFYSRKMWHILDGLRVSKLTANLNFWVNYHFKILTLCFKTSVYSEKNNVSEPKSNLKL